MSDFAAADLEIRVQAIEKAITALIDRAHGLGEEAKAELRDLISPRVAQTVPEAPSDAPAILAEAPQTGENPTASPEQATPSASDTSASGQPDGGDSAPLGEAGSPDSGTASPA